MRKLLPETAFKECDIKTNYYLDLHRKFELSSLISSTVIPVLVFKQTHMEVILSNNSQNPGFSEQNPGFSITKPWVL